MSFALTASARGSVQLVVTDVYETTPAGAGPQLQRWRRQFRRQRHLPPTQGANPPRVPVLTRGYCTARRRGTAFRRGDAGRRSSTTPGGPVISAPRGRRGDEPLR